MHDVKHKIIFEFDMECMEFSKISESLCMLGQTKDKMLHHVYYANKIHKMLLAVVFNLDKFRAYLVSTKVIPCTDHSALKYLF